MSCRSDVDDPGIDIQIIDVGDMRIEVRPVSGTIDLDLKGDDLSWITVSSMWGGQQAASPDGSFEILMATHGTGLVSLETPVGPMAWVVVPVDPWLTRNRITVDETATVASMVYLSSSLAFSEPRYSEIVLARIGTYPETAVAAQAMRDQWIRCEGVDIWADPGHVLEDAMTDVMSAFTEDVRNYAFLHGYEDPFPSPDAPPARYVDEDEETPGQFEPDLPDAALDGVVFEAHHESATDISIDARNLVSRWVSVDFEDEVQFLLPPTKYECPDPLGFVTGFGVFCLEGMLAEGHNLLHGGQNPTDLYGDLWEFLSDEFTEEGSQEDYSLDGLVEGQAYTLSTHGPGAIYGWPDLVGDGEIDRWVLPAVATLLSELALPLIKIVINIPADQAVTHGFVECLESFGDVTEEAQEIALHLRAAHLALEGGDSDEYHVEIFRAIEAFLVADDLWTCLNIPPIFTVDFYEQWFKDRLGLLIVQMSSISNKQFFDQIMLDDDVINIAASLGQSTFAFANTVTDANYVVYASLYETSCSDNVDNDEDGWFDCADLDCAGNSACPVEIHTVIPTSVIQGQQGPNITLEGQNFVTNGVDSPRLSFGDHIAITSATWESTIELTAVIEVDCEATPGQRTIEFAQPNEPYGSDCSSYGRACYTTFTVVEDPMCGLSPEDCDDGIDNDGDGDADCDDLDCYWCDP